MTQDEGTGSSFTARIGRRIRDLRERRGIKSAEDLAERCAKAGMTKLNRSVIANIENGRRRYLTVEEVMVLAYVLDVAPVHLLMPLENDAPVQVTPNLTVRAIEAREWVRGNFQLPGTDMRGYTTEVPESEFPWTTFRTMPPPLGLGRRLGETDE